MRCHFLSFRNFLIVLSRIFRESDDIGGKEKNKHGDKKLNAGRRSGWEAGCNSKSDSVKPAR
uniref:Uncharacterized protein n=1 Tax=Candidatus Kentrum sp. MB TaxID=2138164 RepID=A0A450XI86_9GAMM|nr:MAG: hypothetical protein BECKMB1821G_GA0114241_104433 [Candidatus Kentron sp. MB]VFK29518.1 MAG: hypothetical protein BECKMB1821I_GA0114274_101041 [Candidatus Kentron sp. MB]VFK74814.1 MAG: hypothetical protein BECKMB1821H_GA0114242_101041 [Candidatus Kentron sp. MB]